MGFISSATSLTVLANLTTIGRQKLLMNSSNLITHFMLGDSDANYNVEYPLITGQVPVVAGELSTSSGATNSLTNNFQFRSKLIRGIYDGVTTQNTKKLVEASSSNVVAETKILPQQVISGSSLSYNIVNRMNIDGTGYTTTNLFKSFSLPITTADKSYFTTVPYPNGFMDTALSGINQNEVLIIGIPNNSYGEVIDGKTLKIELNSGGSAYTIYSTYQATLTNQQTQDNNIRETSNELTFKQNSNNPQLVGMNKFGNNVSFLFSDEIAPPNQDSGNSWSTGWNTFKPFSQGLKEQFNLRTNTNLSQTADTCVGIAHLDKGFIIITDPTIVSGFDTSLSGSSATTITFKSVTTEVSQKITCIVNRGEFGTSTNPTFSSDNMDIPRITEIGLLDSTGAIIAVAKMDYQIELATDMFLALGVKIVV